jgi:hypothetical protein
MTAGSKLNFCLPKFNLTRQRVNLLNVGSLLFGAGLPGYAAAISLLPKNAVIRRKGLALRRAR